MLQKLKEELVFKTSELNLLKNKRKELELDIFNKEKSLSDLKNEIELLHSNLDNVNARDKEIYVEKVLLGWSNDKISAKHYSLTRQQISRIVKKVEEDLKMWCYKMLHLFLYSYFRGETNGREAIWN